MAPAAVTAHARPGPAAHALALLLLAAFATAAYLPSFGVPFLFDDLPNIVHNPAVHATGIGDLVAVLESPVSSNRPTALLTFALNHLAGGLDPRGYHAVNLALHVANGALLYALLLLLAPAGSDARRLAFLGALLWLLHPVQTQAVTYVVQRMTALATLFYLLGLLAFVLQRRGRLGTMPAALAWGAAFVLGLTSKEIVASLPFACLLLETCFFAARDRGRTLARLAAASALLAVLLALLYLPGLPDWQARYPNRAFSPLERLLTEPRVLWHYLSLLAWPEPARLHLDYDVALSRDWRTPPTTLPALLGLVLLGAAGWRLRRRWPLTGFALLFFLLASALEASFVNLEIAFVHRIYLPSLFLAAGLLAPLPASRLRLASPALLVLAALLAVATIERNREWRDEQRFWALELTRGASPFRALLNRASTLVEIGHAREAVRLLEQSLPLVGAGERALLETQIATAQFAMAAYAPARARLAALIAREGPRPDWLFLLGVIHAKSGDAAAAAALAAQLATVPGHRPQSRLVAALASAAGGRGEEAKATLRTLRLEAGARDPAFDELIAMQLADLHLAAGEYDAARALYDAAIARRPANHFAWRQLYRLASRKGDAAEVARLRDVLRARGIALPPE